MKANRTTEDGERVPNAFAPGYENWIVGIKGKPDLDIDACRVPRGGGIYGSGAGAGSGNIANQTGNGRTRGGGVGIVAESDPRGSLPKNALLSHCEECVRVGAKEVKASAPPGKPTAGTIQDNGSNAYGDGKPRGTSQYGDGTESVPAFHCLAGCICGARTPWPDDRPLPKCPCGEVWRWLCAVAELNAQSGNRPGMSGGGKHREGYAGGMFGKIDCETSAFADQGGSARFFSTFQYLSKCSSSERHAGCENLFWRANKKNLFGYDQITRAEWEALPADKRAQGNTHATVKSIRQMLWFHAVTGADKIVDLTAGSCSGALAAHLADVEWIGAEVCPEAIVIGKARLAWWSGLSAEAKRTMLKDDIMPTPAKTNELQTSLFQ